MVEVVAPIANNNRTEMLALLDLLRSRVEAGGVRSLLAVEVSTDARAPTLLHDAGDIVYAEIIGYLAMAQLNLWAKSAGVIDP